MKIKEIKQIVNTNKVGFLLTFYRRTGLYVTWVFINLFPMITANFVTFLMLLLGLVSIGILYVGLIKLSLLMILLSFLVFNFSIILDCVDGNISRIKKKSSIFGIILDRISHNIVFPVFFIAIGYYFLIFDNNIVLLSVFLVAGILSELNPVEVGGITALNNIYKHEINNIDTKKYNIDDLNVKEKGKPMKRNLFLYLLELPMTFGFYNVVFVTIILDIMFYNNLKYNFIFTIVFVTYFIIYKIIESIKGLKNVYEEIRVLKEK